MIRRAILVAAAALLLFGGGSAAAPAHFRHERAVVPGGRGANRLSLDVPVLAGARPLQFAGASFSGGLDDLRLFDSSGREVGYLLVPPAAPSERWQSGAVLAIPATKHASGFEVDLGKPLHVDRLRIEDLAAPFLKRMRLEGSGDRQHWSVLVPDGTIFDLPDERLKRTEVDFRAGDFQYLRVTFDDRTSAVVGRPRTVAARVVTAEASPEVARVPVAFERRSSEPGRSRFRLHLPAAHLPVAALNLVVGGGHLLRPARVTEARLRGAEVGPVPLGSHTLQRALRGELAAADLRIPIDPPEGPDLDLAVDDGDNPPLDLLAVEAELVPLAWIYFESAAGESLTARFGDPKLTAPRYDLEAMRGSLQAAAEAHWGEVRDLVPVEEAPPSGDGIPAVGAPIDRSAFGYERAIPAGPIGLTAVVLDAAVVAHSHALGDLRIADGDDRQIPYLVERLDEPMTLELPDPESLPPHTPSTAGRQSHYRLRLPYDSLPAARLVLSTRERVFDRTLTVNVERPATDPRSAPRTERVTALRWRHVETDEAAPDLVIELPALGTDTIELTVDDGDNAPLPISKPRLLLPAQRLRFFRTGGDELRLLYGAPNLAAPRYDLALLAPRVLGAAAHEVSPAAEVSAPPQRSGGAITQARLFWGALLIAVVALLAMVARLVGRGDAPRSPDDARETPPSV